MPPLENAADALPGAPGSGAPLPGGPSPGSPKHGHRWHALPTFHRFTEGLGRAVDERCIAMGHFALFCRRTLAGCVRPPWRARQITQQCIQLGVRAMPITLLTAVFVGMVIVLQAGEQLRLFDAIYLAPGGASRALTQGMIPIFTALVVGARMSASIAAELGTMRVTEQIDAMEVLDAAPEPYLVWPRTIAAALMLPVLTMYADVVGLAGGMLVGVFGLGLSWRFYLSVTSDYLQFSDIVIGLVKSLFFGIAMGLCGSYFGYFARGGAEGVGQATTKAVVYTLTSLVVLEYLLTHWSIYVMAMIS